MDKKQLNMDNNKDLDSKYSSNFSKRIKNMEISDVGVDELRRIFDFEINRSNSLESKAAAVLGFSTLAVTILIFILDFFISNAGENPGLIIFTTLSTLSIILISLSLVNLIYVLKIQKYPVPFEYNSDNLQLYLRKSLDKFKNIMLEEYMQSISEMYKINKRKANSLSTAIIFLVSGILISIISPWILLWIRILT